jgi:hypothetical protein
MHCHGSRSRGDTCNRFLGYASTAVRFARLADRAPERPDGDTWVRCQDCKAWNVFEAVE